MKVLISRKTGIYHYYNEKGDYHCKEGVIKEEDLKSGSPIVKTHTNREYLCFDANTHDITKKFKRGPQIITPKDLGYIVARSGIGRDSIIVESGGGSGAATCFFSRLVKEVHTYEIKEDHCTIIQKNLDTMNCSNVTLTHGDLHDSIESEEKYDLLFLDMPDCHLMLTKEKLSGLQNGHYAICYVPSITQIQDIVKMISEEESFYLEEISEVILRHRRVWDKVARPEHRKETDHTAFLVFIRKVA